jgi:hypothetical protein
MRLIVLTSEPVSGDQLRSALPDGVEPRDAEVMVVAPALHENALRFWVSDADEAIERAAAVGRKTLQQLDSQGVAASADTGESDPLRAVQDALATFDADRIVVFAHPPDQQRYREDYDEEELRERFGLPVDRAEIASA